MKRFPFIFLLGLMASLIISGSFAQHMGWLSPTWAACVILAAIVIGSGGAAADIAVNARIAISTSVCPRCGTEHTDADCFTDFCSACVCEWIEEQYLFCSKCQRAFLNDGREDRENAICPICDNYRNIRVLFEIPEEKYLTAPRSKGEA